MRLFRFVVAAAWLAASTAFASPTAPVNGAEYLTLATPVPVQGAGKKIEVIEFFMYHCPFCNALEPALGAWVKKQGDNIVFRRVHLPYTGPNDPEAHMFLTLEAMGKAEEMQLKIFRAWHVERQRLNKDQAIFDWIAANGVDKARFAETWNSFGVLSKLKRLPNVGKGYKVETVPALVIDGRFLTSPSQVGASNRTESTDQLYKWTTDVMDALLVKAAKEKVTAK